MAINTPQKFTSEELTKIKDLQTKIDKVTTQMGQLYYRKIQLEKQEDILKNELSSIEKEELSLANELTEKYGKGSLDINSGEFTPVK